MSLKVRKSYPDGQDREELTTVLEIGPGLTLTQNINGLPMIDAGASAPQGITHVGTAVNATLTPNFTTSSINTGTLGGNSAVSAPAGAVAGGTYVLILTNGGNGVIAWNSVYKWPAAITPQFTGSGVLIATFIATAPNVLYGVGVADFR